MEYDNTEQALISNQKGQIGQTFFEYLMSSKNIPCFKPLGSYLYDYIIIYNNTPLRVECKSSSTYENGAITFPINHSSGRKNTVSYTKEEVDAVFASFNGGDIRIKNYPANSASSNDFEAYLNDLYTIEGFKPDFIIVDYILITATNKNGDSENSYKY